MSVFTGLVSDKKDRFLSPFAFGSYVFRKCINETMSFYGVYFDTGVVVDMVISSDSLFESENVQTLFHEVVGIYLPQVLTVHPSTLKVGLTGHCCKTGGVVP